VAFFYARYWGFSVLVISFSRLVYSKKKSHAIRGTFTLF
jgi:hypothetical protein